MNEQTRSTISALLDNEVHAGELARISEQIPDSQEMRRLCGRYQLIGDAMRGEKTSPDYLGLADRVSAQLAEEPTVLAPRRTLWRGSWVKPALGVAMAASLAVVAIGWLPRGVIPQLPQQVAAVQQAARTAVYSGHGGTRWDWGKPAVQTKLNTYLVNHRNRAPKSNMQGMIPYASFVAYDRAP